MVMWPEDNEELPAKATSGLNDGLGTAGAVMSCGAVVTNVYEAYEAGRKMERERCISALLAVNPMEVSWCDKIHGDGWWDFKVKEVLERDA